MQLKEGQNKNRFGLIWFASIFQSFDEPLNISSHSGPSRPLQQHKIGMFFMVLYNIAFATSSNESYVNLLINLFFKSHVRLSQPMYKHLQYGRQPPPHFSWFSLLGLNNNVRAYPLIPLLLYVTPLASPTCTTLGGSFTDQKLLDVQHTYSCA